MCPSQATEGRYVMPARRCGDIVLVGSPEADSTLPFHSTRGRYVIPSSKSKDSDPTETPEADANHYCYPTEDRYTSHIKSQQLPQSPREIHIAQSTSTKDPTDPPIEVQAKACLESAEIVPRPPVKTPSPLFARQFFLPIGVCTLLRVPADGLPPHEALSVILEAPRLFGHPSPIRFPDLRAYYPELGMRQVDYQVMRTAPDGPEQSLMGTYLMFKGRSGSSLPQNKHFRNSNIMGDAFIAKVVEHGGIDWGDGESSGSMKREIWTRGVAGIVYYSMPPGSIGGWASDCEGNFFFEESKLLKDILGLKNIDHHDVVDLGVESRLNTKIKTCPNRIEPKAVFEQESIRDEELEPELPKPNKRVAFQAEHCSPDLNKAFINRVNARRVDTSSPKDTPKSILKRGIDRATSSGPTQNHGNFHAEDTFPCFNDCHVEKSLREDAPNIILERDTRKGKERTRTLVQDQDEATFQAESSNPNPENVPFNRGPRHSTLGFDQQKQSLNDIFLNRIDQDQPESNFGAQDRGGATQSTKSAEQRIKKLTGTQDEATYKTYNEAEIEKSLTEPSWLEDGGLQAFTGPSNGTATGHKKRNRKGRGCRLRQKEAKRMNNRALHPNGPETESTTGQIKDPTEAPMEAPIQNSSKSEHRESPSIPENGLKDPIGPSGSIAMSCYAIKRMQQHARSSEAVGGIRNGIPRPESPEEQPRKYRINGPSAARSETSTKTLLKLLSKIILEESPSAPNSRSNNSNDPTQVADVSWGNIERLQDCTRGRQDVGWIPDGAWRPIPPGEESKKEQPETSFNVLLERLLERRLPEEPTLEPSEEPLGKTSEQPRTEVAIDPPKTPDGGLEDGLLEGLSLCLSKNQKRKLRQMKKKARMKEDGTWVQKGCDQKTADNTELICSDEVTP